MYIKVTNGVVEFYSPRKLREDNPDVSFPRKLTEELLAEYGVYLYKQLPKPEYDELTQRVALQDPALQEGKWVQNWQIKELSSAAKEENTRNHRNDLLSDCDWWAVQDRTMSQAEASYRQALRDITNQPTFPDSVVWPEKPE